MTTYTRTDPHGYVLGFITARSYAHAWRIVIQTLGIRTWWREYIREYRDGDRIGHRDN